MPTAKKVPAKVATKVAAKVPAKKAAAARGGADAITLLTSDHKEVKTLFNRYKKLIKSKAPAAEKQPVAMDICAKLTVHATIEEEIFYPAARNAMVAADLLDEAEVEHASCKELIAQIEAMNPSAKLYDAKVTVLGEYIDHHVQEEQDEMFPKVRKTGLDLKALGAELKQRKLALMAAI